MRTEIVTTLKRQATNLLSDLPVDREIMITEHGKPAAFLVDVQTYESTKKRLSLLEGIARGEAAYKDGRYMTNAEAKIRFKDWLE
jgi:prevent-host-death family protein